METWKEIYGYDILFEVSNKGRVRTKYYPKAGYRSEYRYIKPTDNGNGYLRFGMKSQGKTKTLYVHRLVAEAFVCNPEGYTEVNHINEDKQDNSVMNLEWVSHIDNCNHGTRNERCGNRVRIKCVQTGQIFKSLQDAARMMEVSNTALSNCLNGRSKSCAGYTWEYVA